MLAFYYSSYGAPTGQTPAQVPQEIHLEASISHLPSVFTEIAPIGHIAKQL